MSSEKELVSNIIEKSESINEETPIEDLVATLTMAMKLMGVDLPAPENMDSDTLYSWLMNSMQIVQNKVDPSSPIMQNLMEVFKKALVYCLYEVFQSIYNKKYLS